MIFFPSYSARSASSLGWIPGRRLHASAETGGQRASSNERTQNQSTHVSLATRSASTPTGQYAIAVTCPCTSIPPVAVISCPHTRTQDEVKCRE